MAASFALGVPYPFELSFMQRALIAGVAVGVFAPMIGTFLVQKRMSLMGDGIGHIAFAGVGAGLLAGVWPIWTALIFAVGGSLGVEWLRSRRRASGDLALALLFYSGIALGVVLVSLGGGINASVLTYLFGQPLTVSRQEVAVIVGLGALIVVAMLALRRVLVRGRERRGMGARRRVACWGRQRRSRRPRGGSGRGRDADRGHLADRGDDGACPLPSGQLLGRSFRGTMRWSVAVGVAASVAGLAIARIWDLAPSGTIVLVAAGAFMVIALATRRGAAPIALPEPGDPGRLADDRGAQEASV